MTDAGAGEPSVYDPEWVARAARERDPGLPHETALLLARRAAEHLSRMEGLDAPELARRLLADEPDAGASPASVVAAVAVDFASRYQERGGPV